MGSADFSRQALLRGGECCIVFAASVRSPRVPTRSFTLIPVPFTVGVPCSYWTLACFAASSTLHSLFGISVRQASALPRASFRPTPHGGALASGCILPTAGRIRDFHPLERAPAGRTKKPVPHRCSTGRPVIMTSAGYPVRSMSLPFPGTGYYLSVFFLPERGAGSLTF